VYCVAVTPLDHETFARADRLRISMAALICRAGLQSDDHEPEQDQASQERGRKGKRVMASAGRVRDPVQSKQ